VANIHASDLVAENLTKQFDSAGQTLNILCGVSLQLSAGQNLAILGPSGAGKSTLLQILGGLDPPTSGTVRLNGVNPFELSSRELAQFRNAHVGFIFQDHYLLPQLSALENVLIPVLAQQSIGESARNRAEQLLDAVGLAPRASHRPGQLSGGERQRVAVARALIMQPALLLADEPTGSLDAASARLVGQILRELSEQERAILVCVTHSETLAQLFQRRVQLVDGQFAEDRP
jgi:lipoprotein-releasing system ATP-binding protein